MGIFIYKREGRFRKILTHSGCGMTKPSLGSSSPSFSFSCRLMSAWVVIRGTLHSEPRVEFPAELRRGSEASAEA